MSRSEDWFQSTEPGSRSRSRTRDDREAARQVRAKECEFVFGSDIVREMLEAGAVPSAFA
jgi:hypothetical protein